LDKADAFLDTLLLVVLDKLCGAIPIPSALLLLGCLVCSNDSDCAIVPPRPCMCRDCGASWHEVLNRHALHKLQALWAKPPTRHEGRLSLRAVRHRVSAKDVCATGKAQPGVTFCPAK